MYGIQEVTSVIHHKSDWLTQHYNHTHFLIHLCTCTGNYKQTGPSGRRRQHLCIHTTRTTPPYLLYLWYGMCGQDAPVKDVHQAGLEGGEVGGVVGPQLVQHQVQGEQGAMQRPEGGGGGGEG